MSFRKWKSALGLLTENLLAMDLEQWNILVEQQNIFKTLLMTETYQMKK